MVTIYKSYPTGAGHIDLLECGGIYRVSFYGTNAQGKHRVVQEDATSLEAARFTLRRFATAYTHPES